MVRGFLLNNQLTDFSFQANLANGPHPNRVEGGKRPRSSMAPTLVFGPTSRDVPHTEPDRTHAPPTHSAAFAAPPAIATHVGARPMVLAIGSPGGPAIINFVARTLIGVLEEGQPLQQVINAPNLGSRNGPTELELDDSLAAVAGALAARGHRIVTTSMTSGLHGITRRCSNSGEDCVLESGTDPRREGLARGR
jgi:gamma-glutamyltranspeptidase/glutathione hydrolase